MEQIARKRLFTLLIIPLMLIPMASLGYAHFTDSVEQKYKLHVAAPQIEIEDYKICAPCKWGCTIKVSPPRCMLPTDTISISSKISPCWYVWIGLIIHNQGCIPAKVNVTQYIVDDPKNVWKWFQHTEFFYGPYTEEELQNVKNKVWGSCGCYNLPPKCVPSTKPPIVLEPCHRLVIWIKLKYKPPCGCYYKCFSIKIAIKISADIPDLVETSSWTWPPK